MGFCNCRGGDAGRGGGIDVHSVATCRQEGRGDQNNSCLHEATTVVATAGAGTSSGQGDSSTPPVVPVERAVGGLDRRARSRPSGRSGTHACRPAEFGSQYWGASLEQCFGWKADPSSGTRGGGLGNGCSGCRSSTGDRIVRISCDSDGRGQEDPHSDRSEGCVQSGYRCSRGRPDSWRRRSGHRIFEATIRAQCRGGRCWDPTRRPRYDGRRREGGEGG